MNSPFQRQIKQLISQDTWMLDVLKIVRTLQLNDCWIGAGFVRNAIWDHLHDRQRSNLTDIDVIYFDKNKLSKESDTTIENQLNSINPQLKWSVKNQARMHLRNNHAPYLDCQDAISYWPETATAIAVRLTKDNEIEYLAPYGLDDLFNLVVRHSPKSNLASFEARIASKKWNEKWENLKIK